MLCWLLARHRQPESGLAVKIGDEILLQDDGGHRGLSGGRRCYFAAPWSRGLGR